MGSSAAQVAAAVAELMAGKSAHTTPSEFSAQPWRGQETEECPTFGELYVIRAGEHQPAPEVGLFVGVVSGPHSGYDKAIASLGCQSPNKPFKPEREIAPASAIKLEASHGYFSAAEGLDGVVGDFQKLLHKLKQRSTGLSPELEQAAIEGLQSGALGAEHIQVLLKQVDEEAKAASAATEPEDGTEEQILFLPIDTPVWHLQKKDKHGSALMATRAENVELMRMISEKTDSPMAVVEALRQQQRLQKEEEQKRSAELLKQELMKQQQQQQQGTHQFNVLSHLMQLMGSGNALQPPAHVPLPGQGLPRNDSNLSAALAQALSAGPSHGPAQTSSHQSLDFSAVQRDLEAAMGRQRSDGTLLPPPARGANHRRNQSVELTSMYQPESTQPMPSPMPSRPQPVFPQPAPPLRANLSPGSAAPGDGPFLVVAADSRVQLTATGFHLPLVSGPHHDFEAALKAMASAAQQRPSQLGKHDSVHIPSDAAIWHTTDFPQLAHPLMIIKASSTLRPPAQLEELPAEPSPHGPSQDARNIQEQIMENIMAMYRQAQQDQPASACQAKQLTELATDLYKSSAGAQSNPPPVFEAPDFQGFAAKPTRSATRSPSPLRRQERKGKAARKEKKAVDAAAKAAEPAAVAEPRRDSEPATPKRPAPSGPWFRNKKSRILGREPPAEPAAPSEVQPLVDGAKGDERGSPSQAAESSDSEGELEIADGRQA